MPATTLRWPTNTITTTITTPAAPGPAEAAPPDPQADPGWGCAGCDSSWVSGC
ncbi:hypothetical protein [Aquabacterium sp.]|uniref:hypothetical protein n=1 Tax=Aquabacterium sp. TaxID=1872578 RepID=UPI0037850803